MARDGVTIRRNGPYAPLSATYYDDDAIAALDRNEDDRAELLFVRALAFCARNPSLEGFVSSIALETGRVLNRKYRKGTSVHQVAERLVKLGLWTADVDGYRIAKWSKWNRTPSEIEAARKADAERKAEERKSAQGTDTGEDHAA